MSEICIFLHFSLHNPKNSCNFAPAKGCDPLFGVPKELCSNGESGSPEDFNEAVACGGLSPCPRVLNARSHTICGCKGTAFIINSFIIAKFFVAKFFATHSRCKGNAFF